MVTVIPEDFLVFLHISLRIVNRKKHFATKINLFQFLMIFVKEFQKNFQFPDEKLTFESCVNSGYRCNSILFRNLRLSAAESSDRSGSNQNSW